MKIVLWAGNEPNQRALANKVHALIPLSGIVTESRVTRRRVTLPMLAGALFERLFLPSVRKAWQGMRTACAERYPDFPGCPRLDVENINDESALAFTRDLDPDLVIVSGTRLIKRRMLALRPRLGILNLHTGLSPYVKGGPNCTNWCLANGDYHLIGNTVMWIDEGIDTGHVMLSACVPFDGDEDLAAIHRKVMEHAHALYLQALACLAAGTRNRVPQDDIAAGRTWYTRQWGWRQKLAMTRHLGAFRLAVRSGEMARRRQSLRTVGPACEETLS